jgi:inner membrane protein
MIGKTHLIIGTAVGLALVANSHPPAPALVVTAAAIGALLPDLDSHGSLIARKTGPFGWLYPYFVSHRGITHSAVALVMVLLGVALLHRDYSGSEMAGFALWCGYLSHLAADMVTKAGIPLLWRLLLAVRSNRCCPSRFWCLHSILFTCILFCKHVNKRG